MIVKNLNHGSSETVVYVLLFFFFLEVVELGGKCNVINYGIGFELFMWLIGNWLRHREKCRYTTLTSFVHVHL